MVKFSSLVLSIHAVTLEEAASQGGNESWEEERNVAEAWVNIFPLRKMDLPNPIFFLLFIVDGICIFKCFLNENTECCRVGQESFLITLGSSTVWLKFASQAGELGTCSDTPSFRQLHPPDRLVCRFCSPLGFWKPVSLLWVVDSRWDSFYLLLACYHVTPREQSSAAALDP